MSVELNRILSDLAIHVCASLREETIRVELYGVSIVMSRSRRLFGPMALQ